MGEPLVPPGWLPGGSCGHGRTQGGGETDGNVKEEHIVETENTHGLQMSPTFVCLFVL